MNKIIRKLAFILILSSAIFGALMASIIIHEFSHANDFKKVAGIQEMCFLRLSNNFKDSFNGALAYYQPAFKPNVTDGEVRRISKYTEWRAWGIQSLFMLVWVVFLVIFLIDRIENNNIKSN